MTIGGVSGAGGVAMSPNIAGGGLTADSIMLFCASQLNHLDDNIKQHMAQQQAARVQGDKLGSLKALLAGDLNANDVEGKKRIMHAMKDAYDSLPPNDPKRGQLNEMFHQFLDTATFSDKSLVRISQGDINNLWNMDDANITRLSGNVTDGNQVKGEEMTKLAAMIDPMISDIGKGAELEMINLNSIVSQRQMAVQMATQMITKLNETHMAIVAQLGK